MTIAVPILDLAEFAPSLTSRGALLGLDPGARRIGVAISDPERRTAVSLQTITRTKFAADAGAIFALFDSRGAAGLVIGLPLLMNGAAGPAAQSARAFARNLLGLRDAPALMWDERLSTAAVERAQIAADASRAARARKIDALAAAYMLQGALDALACLPDPASP